MPETRLSLNPSTIISGIQQVTNMVAEDEVCPLLAYQFLQQIEKAATPALKKIKEEALEIAERDAGNTLNGYKIGVHTSTTWDYKNIPEWAEKKAELKEIEEKYKLAYAAASKGNALVDEETGEVIQGAVKNSSFSPKFIKISKNL